MTPKEILIAARALIDTPEKWVKGAFALHTDHGTCYCLAGALLKATPGDIFNEDFAAAGTVLKKAINSPSADFRLHLWNDAPERTHSEVLAVVDRAIELS